MQLSQTRATFDKAAELFVATWIIISEELIIYFRIEWLAKHRFCYEFIWEHGHAFRELLDLDCSRNVVCSKVEEWYTSVPKLIRKYGPNRTIGPGKKSAQFWSLNNATFPHWDYLSSPSRRWLGSLIALWCRNGWPNTTKQIIINIAMIRLNSELYYTENKLVAYPTSNKLCFFGGIPN